MMHHGGMSNMALVLSPVNQEKVADGLMIYRAQKGIARMVEYNTEVDSILFGMVFPLKAWLKVEIVCHWHFYKFA